MATLIQAIVNQFAQGDFSDMQHYVFVFHRVLLLMDYSTTMEHVLNTVRSDTTPILLVIV